MQGLLQELYSAADYEYPYPNENDDTVATKGGSQPEAESDDHDWPDFMEVMTGSGYLDFTEYGIAMSNEIRIMWAFTIPFYEQAPNFARDIAFIKYRTDDFSRFPLRFLTATLYTLGLLLLSIPTAQTFYYLSKNVLIRII